MGRSSATPFDINGRTVFITGAARGIGEATAERLHAKGANVALVGLEPELLEENAAKLGERASYFEADVTDLEALERAVDATVERFGGDRRGDRQRRHRVHRHARDSARRAGRANPRRQPARSVAHQPRRDRGRSRRGAATC